MPEKWLEKVRNQVRNIELRFEARIINPIS